jgi:hypothetical protein
LLFSKTYGGSSRFSGVAIEMDQKILRPKLVKKTVLNRHMEHAPDELIDRAISGWG